MGLDEVRVMSHNRAEVTVVIPMYNSAATIERALKSVAAQTLPPRHVIVINDASTDDCLKIVQNWANPNLTLEIVNNVSNLGPSASRNSGWDLAVTEYIAFLDADDAWHPLKLEIQYGLAKDHPEISLIGHRYDIADDTVWPTIEIQSLPIRKFSFNDFLVKNRLSTPTVMIKSVLTNRFAPEQRYSEDYRLWLELTADHGPALYVNLPLARLFKPAYGSSGQSSKSLAMLNGELQTITALKKNSKIGNPMLAGLKIWAITKFLRRKVKLAVTREGTKCRI